MIPRHYSIPLLCGALLSGHSLQASDALHLGQYALLANPLDTELVGTENDKLSRARFNSGLGLALSNPLFDINVNYLLSAHLQEAGDSDQGDLSQVLTASMYSGLLNKWFSVDASIKADSVSDTDGDSYHYVITPGFSRSINKLIDLDMAYNYKLAKPAELALLEETRGYSVGLNGSMGNGRLVWQGLYSESDLFRDQSLQLETTELLDFNSSYRLVSDLHFEFKSLIKNKTLLDNDSFQDKSEKHFGAGLLWSPNERYSFSLNVNKVEHTALEQETVYGGGKFTWSPKRDLDVSLGYGDEWQDGSRGVVFSTKLDLDKS